MVYTFRTVPPCLTQTEFNQERQNIANAVNGLTLNGVRSYPFTYLIRKSGAVYECIDSTHNIVFGGSDGAGTVSGTEPTPVIQAAFTNAVAGDSIFVENRIYTLTSDITITDKKLVVYTDGATLADKKLIIRESTTDLKRSEHSIIKGFTFSGADGGAEVDNVFLPTFEDCLFYRNNAGLTVKSSVTWTEMLQLQSVLFRDCVKGLVFKTPTGSGTGSYANSRLDTVGFSNETNIGTYTHVEVEAGTFVHEGLWTNLRYWHGTDNGISINVLGDMTRTKLFYPVFENFIVSPSSTQGIVYGAAAGSPFIVGAIWLGTGAWTNKISNTHGRYILGLGQTYSQNVSVPIGLSGVYGAWTTVLKTYDFALISIPRIIAVAAGSFAGGDSVQLNCRFVYVDGTTAATDIGPWLSGSTATFTDQQLMWMTKDVSFIDHVEFQAKTDKASTAVTMNVYVLGTGI
jgi:hypothetical protein